MFAGGFDLPGAEAVCATGDVDSLAVLDLLGSLVDKSLIVAEHGSDSVRYRLLETIRQYSAQELVRAEGDAGVQRIRDRHAEYYLALAETARPALSGHGQARWLRRMDAEWDNLRAGFAQLQAEGRAEDVLRLAIALHRFAISRGHPEVLSAVQWAMQQPGLALSPLLVDSLVTLSALIGLFQRKDIAELRVAKMYAGQALALARELGDIRLEARALGQLGSGLSATRTICLRWRGSWPVRVRRSPRRSVTCSCSASCWPRSPVPRRHRRKYGRSGSRCWPAAASPVTT